MRDQVRRIHSDFVAERYGRLGAICTCEATDAATLKELTRRAGIPDDVIEALADTVEIRPYPGMEKARSEAAAPGPSRPTCAHPGAAYLRSGGYRCLAFRSA
jgi:hypothetical protein